MTLPYIGKLVPSDSVIIFARGYNSAENVKLFQRRNYIYVPPMSDHRDLTDFVADTYSVTEAERNVVYGSDPRIIVYRTSKLREIELDSS